MVHHGQRDEAIDAVVTAVQSEIDSGEILFVGYAIAVLVDLLAGRSGPDDLGRASGLVAEFESNLPAVPVPAVELWLLLCKARLARAVGDIVRYTEVVTRYRQLAEELDARGHLSTAELLADGSF
jgi:hypothetical protein